MCMYVCMSHIMWTQGGQGTDLVGAEGGKVAVEVEALAGGEHVADDGVALLLERLLVLRLGRVALQQPHLRLAQAQHIRQEAVGGLG